MLCVGITLERDWSATNDNGTSDKLKASHWSFSEDVCSKKVGMLSTRL